MFVKPSNSGSSVGITKVKTKEELEKAIEYASKYDTKIIVEQGINAREIECAVLGNEEVISSCLGEILSAEEFYSYDSKYNNQESKTVIPANLPKEVTEEIQKQAKKAFKAVDGKGLSRVDFFVEKETNEVIINEINTLPGFTSISMYPELMKASGINTPDLLDKLVELAIENWIWRGAKQEGRPFSFQNGTVETPFNDVKVIKKKCNRILEEKRSKEKYKKDRK